MILPELLALLKECPIVPSVQAWPTSPLADPDTLLKLAQASLKSDVKVLRLGGTDSINLIRRETGIPVIGLIKRDYDGFGVYITPTMAEVVELLDTGCEVVAVDGTQRPRPGDVSLKDLVTTIHSAGRLVLADCDTMDSVRYSVSCGADIVSTTLAGYTMESHRQTGPDLEFLRTAVREAAVPVFGEGRYSEKWEVEAALLTGASAVVIGGAINDPIKQTELFVSAVPDRSSNVAAVDIGGTWMRFGVFNPEWQLLQQERIPTPTSRNERLEWIKSQVAESPVRAVGIATGGTVDPATGVLWEAKDEVIAEATGTNLSELGLTFCALNDGLATAWGHACLPQYAGLRVATLALGTGVGCGVVDRHRILSGKRGEYARLNDLPFESGTIEEALGGLHLSDTAESRDRASRAAAFCVRLIQDLFHPDVVVVCGGVGLSDRLQLEGVDRSPFGQDAGLYGAAALALYSNGLRGKD